MLLSKRHKIRGNRSSNKKEIWYLQAHTTYEKKFWLYAYETFIYCNNECLQQKRRMYYDLQLYSFMYF